MHAFGLFLVQWKHWSANPWRNSHTAIVSINILSKYSSLISHRCSKVDTSTIDLRWSTHQSPIFEGRHIDHRSLKVNTSISEGRLIDLRKSTHPSPKVDTSWHRSSKGDTSIFESRRIDLRRSRRKHHTYNSSSKLSTTALEWTKLHTLIRTCIKRNNI